MSGLAISKAEVARQLGVSRTYVTLLCQGKRIPGQQIANKIKDLMLTCPEAMPMELTNLIMGKRGLEPRCLSEHDPKSCLPANSSTCMDMVSTPTNGQLQQ